MRVAMYYNNHDVRLEEMPNPKIGKGELLIRVEASGICGTDVLEWYRVKRAPLVLGHEIGGTIVEVGEGVKRYKVGQRVSASHHVPCNTCHYCKMGHHTVCETLRKTHFHPGGFAEYVRLPAINVEHGVYPIPDEVSFEEATFIEPVACVLRGQRQAGMKPGMNVLVLGSGISGLLHINLARSQGANRVVATDIVDYRLEAAKRFGADVSIKAEEDAPKCLREITNGLLADLVIVCTSSVNALEQALKAVERGGTILFFAPTNRDFTIPISINDIFWRNEMTLTSSYAGSPQDHLEALELIRSKKLKVRDMITHILPLPETGKGFELVVSAKESVKVIVEPQK